MYAGDIVKEGFEIHIESKFPSVKAQLVEIFINQNLDIVHPLTGYISSEVIIHGQKYRSGAALLLSWHDDIPTFGIISQILVYDHMKTFILDNLANLGFDEHFNAYIVKSTEKQSVVAFPDLENKWPLCVYPVGDVIYITNRYSHFVEHI